MANAVLLSIFVCLISLAKSVPISCPNIEDLNPCTCTRVAYGLQVRCADFQSASSLERVLQILGDYQVHTLMFHNINIEEILPGNIFKGKKIREIRIGHSSLKFDEPAFAGLDSSLSVLNVEQKSMIQSNETFKIAKLSKLTVLDIKNNQIKKVCGAWLQGKVPNIKKLVLDYNDIHTIQGDAFSSLSNLEHISLSDNRIKEITRSMFPLPATHLRKIDLSFNDLSSLPDDFFEQMPSLKEVILSGNSLKTLPESTWLRVWDGLSKVYLLENQIECDDRLNWIKEIKKPEQFEGTCRSPKSMQGKRLKDL